MIKYLLNWFVYAVNGFWLLFRLYEQKKFMKRILNSDLAPFIEHHDESLDERDFSKIRKYYGLAVPGVLGEAFALLRGKKMTLSERSALTYLGGLTGLADDFFDKTQTRDQHILSLIKDEKDVNIRGSNEELFMTLYRKALSFSIHREEIITRCLEVFEAQIDSKKQSSPSITQDEIKNITYRKGGSSLVFYRAAMDHSLDSEEMKMLHALGSLFQLENDIFDVYKDHKNNIQTLVTTETRMQDLQKKYRSLIREFIQSVDQLAYSSKNKKQFIRLILVVISRGCVALRQLKKNQKKSQQVFAIDQYERKDLICDMEKLPNIFRTTHYFAKVNPR
ncbi:MAG: class 1 isoprenoid biosynthesis enzyme [Bacteroidales bacterium]|nr:class 1 isoprenoid biosynthesis enzyme [Bacteroidales bacterium]